MGASLQTSRGALECGHPVKLHGSGQAAVVHPPRATRDRLGNGAEVLQPLMPGISAADRNDRKIVLTGDDSPLAVLRNDNLSRPSAASRSMTDSSTVITPVCCQPAGKVSG